MGDVITTEFEGKSYDFYIDDNKNLRCSVDGFAPETVISPMMSRVLFMYAKRLKDVFVGPDIIGGVEGE